MFENSMEIEAPVGAIEVLMSIAIAAVLVIVVVGFCMGAVHVDPADLNIARFGGI